MPMTAEDIFWEAAVRAGKEMREKGISREQARENALQAMALKYLGTELAWCPKEIKDEYYAELAEKRKQDRRTGKQGT